MFGCGPKSEPVEHYHARGVVTAIERDSDGTSLTIHHERIAPFKDRDGKSGAMDSMKMRFALEGPSADGLASGDKLGFDFDVHWDSGSALRITKLEKLPASTPLALSDEHR